jgi:hypothetical protein
MEAARTPAKTDLFNKFVLFIGFVFGLTATVIASITVISLGKFAADGANARTRGSAD